MLTFRVITHCTPSFFAPFCFSSFHPNVLITTAYFFVRFYFSRLHLKKLVTTDYPSALLQNKSTYP